MLLSDIYITHLIITIFFCMLNIKEVRFLTYFVIIYHILLLMLTRTVEFKQDLINYYNYGVWGFYTIREPVFTLINSFSYKIFGQNFVFLIADTLSVLLIFYTLKNRNLNYLYLFCFMCFFPVIMGFQSIYRQHFGTLILLWVMSVGFGEKQKFSNLFSKLKKTFGLFAPITHNVHFVSLIASLITRFNSVLVITIAVLIGLGLLRIYGILGKANVDTGGSTAILFALILLIITFIFRYFNKIQSYRFCLFGFTLIFMFTLGGLETPAERTGMVFLILAWPMLAGIVNNAKPKRIVLAGFAIIGCVPIFISAARTLLQASV